MQEENQPFLPGGTARSYASRYSLTARTPSVLAAAVGRFPLGSRDPAGIVTFRLKCPPPAAACKTGEQNGGEHDVLARGKGKPCSALLHNSVLTPLGYLPPQECCSSALALTLTSRIGDLLEMSWELVKLEKTLAGRVVRYNWWSTAEFHRLSLDASLPH